MGVAQNPGRNRKGENAAAELSSFRVKTMEGVQDLELVVLNRQIVMDEQDTIGPLVSQRHRNELSGRSGHHIWQIVVDPVGYVVEVTLGQ